jgi:nitroimidazol reductase NimA-like FMN-containing flavoprotein (pyridoxamine 5'-phosphate oxidase superfamily)
MVAMALGFDDQGLVRLDEEECWRFLAHHFLGRVGFVHLGSPMVFPVNYTLDDRSVVFRTAPGTKLSLAAIGVRVAFEVDEATELFETGTSVVVHGSLHEVTDRAELARLRQLPIRTWAPGDRDHVLRVRASHVTGRRIPMHQHDDGLDADAG